MKTCCTCAALAAAVTSAQLRTSFDIVRHSNQYGTLCATSAAFSRKCKSTLSGHDHVICVTQGCSDVDNKQNKIAYTVTYNRWQRL